MSLAGGTTRPGLRVNPGLALVLVVALGASACGSSHETADLVLGNGRLWTGVAEAPWAEAIAIRGDRILAVGGVEAVELHRGRGTDTVDLGGAFVCPGFIDNHTHFERAGSLLLGVNLLSVSTAEGLRRELASARDRLPEGAWIVGGDWGAYEAWALGSSGTGAASGGESGAFDPDRALIDPITPTNPVLLSRWDGERFLANRLALDRAGAACDWGGVECVDEEMTGRLDPVAAARVRAIVPAKSFEQRLAEGRVALDRLASHGVTGIHDITGANQLRVFRSLAANEELTTRVYARPTLDHWEDLAAVGIEHGFGDRWLRIGGLKGFVDGIMGNSSARFYEPYLTTGTRGSWRRMMEPEGNMRHLVASAVESGHWPQVHAIGDEAIDVLLDIYEQVLASTERTPRLRVIHTQVLRGPEVAERMARLGVIAEMQPYHAIDDMRWMEERIGERARWAYAFRTLRDAGVRLSFGSDWPGTNASWYPSDPLLGIYAAVTRQTLDGAPEGGWYPQERIDVQTALEAYTVVNAWAAGEEAWRGTLEPGNLADLVVLSGDPFAVDPSEIKELRVERTLVGGRWVYEAPAADS